MRSLRERGFLEMTDDGGGDWLSSQVWSMSDAGRKALEEHYGDRKGDEHHSGGGDDNPVHSDDLRLPGFAAAAGGLDD